MRIFLLLFLVLPLWAQRSVLVIVPHPDDEALGFYAAIYRHVLAGDNVRVIVSTVGSDTNPDYTSNMRQGESVAGMATLGVAEDHVIFLGYTHTIKPMYDEANPNTVHPSSGGSTLTNATRGLGHTDWHTYHTGSPARYTANNFRGDLRSVIEAYQPEIIYSTHEYDGSADHATLGRAVKAVVSAGVDGCSPWVYSTFLYDGTGLWPGVSTNAVAGNWMPLEPWTTPAPPSMTNFHGLQWSQFVQIPVPTKPRNDLSMDSADWSTNLCAQTVHAYASATAAGDPPETYNRLYSFCRQSNYFAITQTGAIRSQVRVGVGR